MTYQPGPQARKEKWRWRERRPLGNVSGGVEWEMIMGCSKVDCVKR